MSKTVNYRGDENIAALLSPFGLFIFSSIICLFQLGRQERGGGEEEVMVVGVKIERRGRAVKTR